MNTDFLHPIVVKELRQGLKSRSYFAVFLGLQVAMVLSMVFYFASADGNGDKTFAEGFFWFMLGLMLLVFMPMRGFQAIHEEIRGGTLEMLFLTRMKAWDIAFGKWVALGLQSLLLVTAVLPYLVIRYFLGAVDLAGDLGWVACELGLSLLLVAVAVGLSAWKNKWMRGVLVAGALLSLYLVPMMMVGMRMGGGGGGWMVRMGWEAAVLVVSVGILGVFYFIEYGASQIAPPAENHATRKRLLALLVFGVFGGYCVVEAGEAGPMRVGMMVLVPVLVDAVCEPVLLIPTLYRWGGEKRGWGWRWLFLPGWPSGVLFSVAVLLGLGGLLLQLGTPAGESVVWVCALMNLLLFPVSILVLLPLDWANARAAYLLVQVGTGVLTLVGGVLLSVMDLPEIHAKFWASASPHAGVMVCLFGDAEELNATVAFTVTLLVLTPIVVRLPAPIARIRRLLEGAP